MSDTPTPPHLFANHVIQQMVAHLLGDDMVVEFEDYQAMRTAFRSVGGKWTEITAGNISQIKLLSEVVLAWSKMPNRKRKGDRVI